MSSDQIINQQQEREIEQLRARVKELEQQVANLEGYMLRGFAFRDELQAKLDALEKVARKIRREGGVMAKYHRTYYRAYNEDSGRWETLEACPYCTSLKEDITRMQSCLTSISEDGDDKGADMASRAERYLEWLDKKAALAEVEE